MHSDLIGKCIGLYGAGIGFPQYYTDEEGEREPWVGFGRSIEQAGLIVEDFYNTLPNRLWGFVKWYKGVLYYELQNKELL